MRSRLARMVPTIALDSIPVGLGSRPGNAISRELLLQAVESATDPNGVQGAGCSSAWVL